MSSYLKESLAQLKIFEGVVQWMYLDSVGKVTVGVGLMLPTAQAAAALPFIFDNRPAVPQEIIVDFRRVSSLTPNRAPNVYKSAMSVLLTMDEIDRQLQKKVAEFETGLRSSLPGYDSYPDPAKLALIDMAYNLGLTGVTKGYPKMMAAVKARDWNAAANDCYRKGPSQARNDWTKQQFLSCSAVESITASATSTAHPVTTVAKAASHAAPPTNDTTKPIAVKKSAVKKASAKVAAKKAIAKKPPLKPKNATAAVAKKAVKKAAKKTPKKRA